MRSNFPDAVTLGEGCCRPVGKGLAGFGLIQQQSDRADARPLSNAAANYSLHYNLFFKRCDRCHRQCGQAANNLSHSRNGNAKSIQGWRTICARSSPSRRYRHTCLHTYNKPFGLFPRSGAEPMSISTLRRIAIAGLGALLLSVQTASSFGPTEVYRATEAIDYVLGSTRAIGYFQTVAGQCLLTLMIAEVVDLDRAA